MSTLRGEDGPGEAGKGQACIGEARQGREWLGEEWLGTARNNIARYSTVADTRRWGLKEQTMDPNVLCDPCKESRPIVWFFGPDDKDEVLCLDCWCETEEAHMAEDTMSECQVVWWSTAEVQ